MGPKSDIKGSRTENKDDTCLQIQLTDFIENRESRICFADREPKTVMESVNYRSSQAGEYFDDKPRQKIVSGIQYASKSKLTPTD